MSEKRWTQQQEHATIEEATALWELLQVVRSGGTLTITGTGPLSSPSSQFARFTLRLQSHSGARYVSGDGATLAECLKKAADSWGNL